MREAGRRHGEQLLGQLLGRLVGVFGEDHLVRVVGGCANGGDDARMPVAVGDHPPGGDGVDDPPAVGGENIGSLRCAPPWERTIAAHAG